VLGEFEMNKKKKIVHSQLQCSRPTKDRVDQYIAKNGGKIYELVDKIVNEYLDKQ